MTVRILQRWLCAWPRPKVCIICGTRFDGRGNRKVCPNSQCATELNKRRAKEWRATNRDWVKQYSRTYNRKEANLARVKKWNATHREWIRLRSKLHHWEQRTLANAMRKILEGE